jgi:hypothetical protein
MSGPALAEYRSILDLDVEQVDFLISMRDLTAFIDPDDCVLDLARVIAWLVYADVDG